MTELIKPKSRWEPVSSSYALSKQNVGSGNHGFSNLESVANALDVVDPPKLDPTTSDILDIRAHWFGRRFPTTPSPLLPHPLPFVDAPRSYAFKRASAFRQPSEMSK